MQSSSGHPDDVGVDVDVDEGHERDQEQETSGSDVEENGSLELGEDFLVDFSVSSERGWSFYEGHDAGNHDDNCKKSEEFLWLQYSNLKIAIKGSI